MTSAYFQRLKKSDCQFLAPAKINLFLEVLGKRPDGYHEVHTILHTLDLCDQLTFEITPPTQGFHLYCSDPLLPSDETNLVLRAVKLMEPYFPNALGLAITLEKHIPSNAGLGGGSSDAAITLLALNDLLNLKLPLSVLSSMAAQLGSDVPFFLWGGTALCTGRGERVEPLALEGSLILVLTSYRNVRKLSTGEVYKNLAPLLTQPLNSDRITKGNLSDLVKSQEVLYNRLEQPAFYLYPALKSLKKMLMANYYSKTLLSGSGTFFFSVQNSLGDQERHYSCLNLKPEFQVIKACSFL